MIGSTYLNGTDMAGAQLSHQPLSVRDTVGLPITVWGTFFEIAHREAIDLSGSTSSSRQRAHVGCGALAPYLHASRALDPFGPHITSVMTLVARYADFCYPS